MVKHDWKIKRSFVIGEDIHVVPTAINSPDVDRATTDLPDLVIDFILMRIARNDENVQPRRGNLPRPLNGGAQKILPLFGGIGIKK